MRVLIVEDDKKLGNLLKRALGDYFIVDRVENADDAVAYIETYRYDALVLDRMLDGSDRGLLLIDRFKSASPDGGVLVISARSETEERILGLQSGADDYLPKPLDVRELVARLQALMRRHLPKEITVANVRLNLFNEEVRVDGKPVTLTRKENLLLFALARRPGHIVTKDELLNALYEDPASVASNTIEATIKSLRKKLPDGLIKTFKTRGYQLDTSLQP